MSSDASAGLRGLSADTIIIESVLGREVLDSRGNPTVEAEVVLSNGVMGRALVPSGASTGSHEAVELRDRDASRFGGNGVLQAVSNVNNVLGGYLAKRSPFFQEDLDQFMVGLDHTNNKGELGANAILSVSLAVAHAAAAARGISLWRYVAEGGPVSLPVPMFNHTQRRPSCLRFRRHPRVHGSACGSPDIFRRIAGRGGDLSIAAISAPRRRSQLECWR